MVAYVITVHWRSDRWLDVQRSYLDRYMGMPFRVYASTEGIDRLHHSKFDFVTEDPGTHAEKLNALAKVVVADAEPDDVIIFLDGDAFPVAPLHEWLSSTLGRHPIAAVRRDENHSDRQPHPSFCATTVGFWEHLGGDWREGCTWHNSKGEAVTDVGGNLLGLLQDHDVDWLPLLRTNTVDLHPLHFGIYGDVVYHHGAGFRLALSRVDLSRSGRLLYRMNQPGRERTLPRRVVYRVANPIIERRAAANRALDRRLYDEMVRNPEFFKQFQR